MPQVHVGRIPQRPKRESTVGRVFSLSNAQFLMRASQSTCLTAMMPIEPRYSDWLGTKRDCAVGYGSCEGLLFNNQHSIDTDDVTMDAEIVNKPIWCCPGICPVQQPDNTMSDMFAQRQSLSYRAGPSSQPRSREDVAARYATSS